MKRKHLDFDQYKREAFVKDQKLKKEYDRLQPEFALVRLILKVRMKKKLTQKMLAKKLGTKQSAISRLESGSANPSLNFLHRLAEALNSRLEIRLVPR